MKIVYLNKEDLQIIITDVDTDAFLDATVLVTGGAGFLGTWMCDALILGGAKVICVDNLSSGLESNIHHLKSNHNFSFKNHDISSPLRIEPKIDYIIHMASRAGPFEFEKFPLEIIRSNTLGTMNVLDLARKNNARVLFTSTSEAYGDAEVIPTPETYFGKVNSVGIRGCYDESKRCGEALCMAYCRQYGVDARIVRIFNTYGPGIRSDGIYGRVIPRFISQCQSNEDITVFGDGSQTRSFTYVTDQITGQLQFLTKEDLSGEVINIGTTQEITILDLAMKIRELTNSSSEITFNPLPQDDPRRRRPEITKAKEMLGWEPRASLDYGLKKMVGLSK